MRELYTYSLSPDQVVQATRRNAARAMQRMHTRILYGLASGAFFGALGYIGAEAIGGDGMLAGAAAIAIAGFLLAVFAQRQGIFLLVRRSPLLAGSWQLGLDTEGIWLRGPNGESFTRWPGWREVEEYRDTVLLCTDALHSHPIAFSAFESGEERHAFIEQVKAKIAAAGGAAMMDGETPQSSPVIANSPPRQAPKTRHLLETAFRLAFFRRVSQTQLDVSWLQVMAVATVSLLIPLASALVTVGSEGRFTWHFLPGAIFHVSVMLAASALLAALVRGTRVSQLVMASLLAWCVIDFITLGAWLAADEFLGESPLAIACLQFVPAGWLSVAVARYVLSLALAPAPRAGWVIAVCAVVLALPLGGVYRERSLWSMDYSRASKSKDGYADMMTAASEEALYRQPELLKRSLDVLAPGRKGIVDLYFVGMAGYGHQDVFMREVDSVAALFRERFQAEGHTVKLINNPKTVLSTPVASATSLKATVNRIGEVMDKDEDVLVLFLTSHGSGDHKFSLELWPLQFKQITPAMLREILDGSGIRNRVVIISACYAGGFIKQLEDDHTLVIAAAAPDKNSFGCSNENDWTYFGKAYFDEALRKTTSFTKAFEIAKPAIEARERQEKFDPSQPQMSVGSAIQAKLDVLERQLERPGQGVN